MNGRVVSLIFFLGLAGMLHPAPCYADKAAEIRHDLAVKKAAHAALLKKSTALNSEVASLKNNLVKTSKDLRIAEEKLSGTDQKLKDLQLKKEQYLENLYKDQKAMGGLISAVKKYSRTSTPDMLAKTNPIDAARASLIMKSLMPRIQQQSTYLKSQLSEISKIEDSIADQLQMQTRQNQQMNKQQDSLAALLQERRKVYQSTESERQAQEKEVARLIKESRNLEELMVKLKTNTQPKRGGKTAVAPLPSKMLAPVHGTVRIGFGEKDDLGADSKGITFVTRPGAGVVVPLAGVVKFAGTFQKYKQILIVEHKGGYHSLIAGLARIDTVVGASLAAGEPVGITEAAGSPQIYYELRRNGKPVNPKNSLIAQRKQEKS